MKALVRPTIRLLTLPLMVTAVAMWLKGGLESGGGFTAGIVAASAWLLLLVAYGPEYLERFWVVRRARVWTVGGLVVVVSQAVAPMLAGYPLLRQYPKMGEYSSHFGILEVRTQVLFEFGVLLVVFGFIVEVTTIIADIYRRER